MRWVLVGSALVLTFDVVTAAGAVALGYEYGSWLPGLAGSVAVHTVAPFMVARETGRVREAVLVGAAVGAVDATIGWATVATLFGVALPSGPPDPGALLLTVALVAMLAALVGWVAGMVAVRLRPVAQ